MSALARVALPLLAAAGAAYAQDCSISATTTIQNSGDATAFAACETFTGSIAIETGTAGGIEINGIQVLKGNLIVKNTTELTSLGADSLEEIDGEFVLDAATKLTALNFPALGSVKSMRFISLPGLNNLGFSKPVTKAPRVSIENTDLLNLQGLNLEEVENMFIANNRFINTIEMQLSEVAEALTIVDNSPELQVSFPELTFANNMTFRNCSSVSVPSIETLDDSLILVGNVFESFSAPNLTEVKGALSFVSNTELSNITFPQLTKVGQNLELANNTKLQEIEGFPKLKSVEGALDFNGNITKIDMPAFESVKGAFNIQSTGDIQGKCDEFFKPIKDKGRIAGKYVCIGSVEKPGGEGTDPKTGGKEKKTGAASAMQVQSGLVFAGLAAAFFL